MPTCHVCGNDYPRAFTVTLPEGTSYAFDSVECAAHSLAPACANCGVRILGHGLDSTAGTFCCAHCARQAGAHDAHA